MSESKTTLKEAIASFLKDSQPKLTKKYSDYHFRNLYRLEEYFGSRQIAHLLESTEDFTGFFNHLKNKYKLNPASIYYIVLQIRNFLRFCIETELITESVDIDKAINYKQYARDYQKHFQSLIPEAIYPFDEYEMRRYWMWQDPNVISLRNAMVINILFDTGIKTSELLSLGRANLDTLNNVIELKGKRPRKLEVSNITSKLIDAYLDEREDDSPYLVVNHSANVTSRITPRSLERIIKYTSNSIDSLTEITMGMIRQSFIAKKISSGKNRGQMKDLMGYSHYHVPQLNKFSIHEKATQNKPEKNVKRYLEDFEVSSKLQDEYEVSDKKIDEMIFIEDMDIKFVSRTLLLRESQVIQFIDKVKQAHEGYVPVAFRQKEWGLSRDLFIEFGLLYPNKMTKLSRILYIVESLSKEDLISSIKLTKSQK